MTDVPMPPERDDPSERMRDPYGPGMPSMPPVSGTYGQDPGAVRLEQPPSVRNAVRLMYLGALVSAIGLAVSALTVGSLRSEIRSSLQRSGQTVSDSSIDAAVNVTIAVGIVTGVIAILLWLWMAWKNGQGRQWARVVATVLGALNIISTIYSLVGGRSVSASAAVAVVNLIIAIAIIVLLYRPDSSAFFRSSS